MSTDYVLLCLRAIDGMHIGTKRIYDRPLAQGFGIPNIADKSGLEVEDSDFQWIVTQK